MPSNQEPRKHCWHHDGSVYDTYPSFHHETCCHCGKSRTVGGRIDRTGHGPHLRSDVIVREAPDPGPCVREQP